MFCFVGSASFPMFLVSFRFVFLLTFRPFCFLILPALLPLARSKLLKITVWRHNPSLSKIKVDNLHSVLNDVIARFLNRIFELWYSSLLRIWCLHLFLGTTMTPKASCWNCRRKTFWCQHRDVAKLSFTRSPQLFFGCVQPKLILGAA